MHAILELRNIFEYYKDLICEAIFKMHESSIFFQ